MDNTNRGAIWPNKKKEKDTHPDFTGQLNVDGTEYWVNAWKRKEGAPSSTPSLSFTIRPKDEKTMPVARTDGRTVTTRRSAADDLQDEVPF